MPVAASFDLENRFLTHPPVVSAMALNENNPFAAAAASGPNAAMEAEIVPIGPSVLPD